MPIQINEENGGKILVVDFNGKLGKADYEHFVPEFERLLRQHGKLGVLIDSTGFHGQADQDWIEAETEIRRGQGTSVKAPELVRPKA